MAERRRLGPLEEALRALVAWFDATETRGVIVGGVAASLLGRPRVTGDVDALAFARRSCVLLLRHQPSGIRSATPPGRREGPLTLPSDGR